MKRRSRTTPALIVDTMGFPKRSMILEGNASEPDTLLTMLEKIEVVDGTDNHPRTVVIDAGIATEDNHGVHMQKRKTDERTDHRGADRGAIGSLQTIESSSSSFKKNDSRTMKCSAQKIRPKRKSY